MGLAALGRLKAPFEIKFRPLIVGYGPVRSSRASGLLGQFCCSLGPNPEFAIVINLITLDPYLIFNSKFFFKNLNNLIIFLAGIGYRIQRYRNPSCCLESKHVPTFIATLSYTKFHCCLPIAHHHKSVLYTYRNKLIKTRIIGEHCCYPVYFSYSRVSHCNSYTVNCLYNSYYNTLKLVQSTGTSCPETAPYSDTTYSKPVLGPTCLCLVATSFRIIRLRIREESSPPAVFAGRLNMVRLHRRKLYTYRFFRHGRG